MQDFIYAVHRGEKGSSDIVKLFYSYEDAVKYSAQHNHGEVVSMEII